MDLTTAEPAVLEGSEKIHELNEGAGEQMDSFWLTFLGVIPLLGLAPLLIVEAKQIWDRPHYRFAPLVLLMAVALIAVNFRDARPERKRFLFASGVGVVGCALGLMSIWFFMPRLAHLSLGIILYAWLLGQLGETRWSRVLALVTLVMVTIPWPFNQDIAAMRALQGAAAQCTSSVLDALGILHWLDGNTLNARYFSIPTTRVGGGPDSFLFFLGLASICVALRRHGYVAAILLFLSVPVWFIVYGVITQTVLSIYGNTLTTSGVSLPFLPVRIVGFVLTVVCFVLFEIALVALMRPAQWSKQTEDEWLIDDEIMRYRPPIEYTSQQAVTRMVSTPAAVLLLLSGLVGAFLIARNYNTVFSTSQFSMQSANEIGQVDTLPAEVGDWKRSEYKMDAKLAAGGYVIPQFNWRYTRGLENVNFSLTVGSSQSSPVADFERQNWRAMEESSVLPEGVQLPCEIIQLRNAMGAQAFLMLSNVSVTGQVAPENPGIKENLSMWRSIFAKLAEQGESKNFQMFEVEVFYPTIAEQRQLDPSVAGLVGSLLRIVGEQTSAKYAPATSNTAAQVP